MPLLCVLWKWKLQTKLKLIRSVFSVCAHSPRTSSNFWEKSRGHSGCHQKCHRHRHDRIFEKRPLHLHDELLQEAHLLRQAVQQPTFTERRTKTRVREGMRKEQAFTKGRKSRHSRWTKLQCRKIVEVLYPLYIFWPGVILRAVSILSVVISTVLCERWSIIIILLVLVPSRTGREKVYPTAT